ncbi:MAG: hypothetical protein NC131_07330 [Roseburia sp.]|nr:hypothetical protein [Roseburia sp.]
MKYPKVIHVHFKESDTDEYYTSIAALYQYHDRDDLGIVYRTLVNALHASGFYENKNIIVKTGVIKSMKQSNKQ